jgi:uncharacterized membrane protein YfcA
MDILKFLILMAVGGASGAIGALCGVGGGIILVPVLAIVPYFLLDQKQAVATSLAVIIITSLVATLKNTGNGFVQWPMAVPLALGSVVVTWFASDTLKTLSNEALVKIFAVVMILAGISMLILRKG